MSDQTPGGFPYRQHPHELCGSNTERQEVGDPGHCEDCCSVGHVVAHPELGCGDVGCYRAHGEPGSDQTPRVPELWWSAREKALWEKDNDGYFCPDYYPIKSGKELPADAVKLGDVEELQNRLDWILNSVRRALVWGRDSETEALEDIRRHAEGGTR